MARTKKTKKTTTTTTTSTRSTVNLCAFCAMVIAAFMYVFSGIINILLSCVDSIGASKSAGALRSLVSIGNFIGSVALIIAIALPAYAFVRGRNRNWKVCYWIALVFFAFGVVLGMIGGIL
ncbi:MAG: hypothetical protein HFE41_02135 [Clostridia bacterium]|nr:hypothetical protein [Clostridia bacterium]